MYTLRDLVEIDKRFQNSVNLQLDLENDRKLNGYIPTRSSLTILSRYVDAVLKEQGFRASILIGPYGKGKSHLLLVLLRILGAKDAKELEEVLAKIEAVDSELAKQILAYKRTGKRLLPVLVSGSNPNLSDAFRYALLTALEREHLTDLMPSSYFSEALKCLEQWKNSFPDTYQAFAHHLTEASMTLEQMKASLHRMDEHALHLFRKFYPEVTAGSSFAPIVNMDIMKIYEEVGVQLRQEYGYDGMFVVFDEFSKYIEGHEQATFARDMKILQDMCELAAGASESQLHIVFVAHKSIKEYGTQLPASVQNAFTGVEGRLLEVPFFVSAKNNFELIRNVIRKSGQAYQNAIRENPQWQDILDASYQLPCMRGLFEQEDYIQTVAYGCFPLFPMTAYLLLAISEKIAQNERSVFTFLANEEPGSLVYLIEHARGAAYGIGADAVYDYFQNLFRENTSMPVIHAEWLKAEYALSKTTDEQKRKLIKVLALLKMVANPEEVPVDARTIALSAGMAQADAAELLAELEKEQIIIWRVKFACYAFKNNIGINLDQEIKNRVLRLGEQINICEILQRVSDLEYILPKQHNQEYTMTRYFHYVYMTTGQFLDLPKASYLFEEKPADGKIIALLGTDVTTEELTEKLRNLKEERIVVLYPKVTFTKAECLKNLLVVEQLQKDPEFMESNRVLQQELKLYEEDLLFEINAELERLYLPQNRNCYVLHEDKIRTDVTGVGEFNRMLSGICGAYYAHAPKINNEQINRKHITAQMKRARNQIVQVLLAHAPTDRYEQGTSPEATIFRATMVHTGIMGETDSVDAGSRYVLECIGSFIQSCAGKKQSFRRLYDTLLGRGCGARNGILPIFLASRIAELEDTPVILLKEKELAISAEVLGNLDENPDDYYLYVEKKTAEKEWYLQALEKEFLRDGHTGTGQTRLQQITDAMQKWYRSLPQITLNFKQCPENLPEKEFSYIRKLRSTLQGMEINPRELLFEKLPQACGETRSYKTCAKHVTSAKKYLDGYLDQIRKDAIRLTKQVFGAKPEDGLYGVLKEWYEEQSDQAKQYLANHQVTGFMGYLKRMQTHDEYEIVEKLVKCVMDVYLEDWKDDSIGQYRQELAKIRHTIEELEDTDEQQTGQNVISFVNGEGQRIEKFYDPVTEDSTSYFLKNAIEDALDEFGNTLEVNQKVAVLVEMLDRLTR